MGDLQSDVHWIHEFLIIMGDVDNFVNLLFPTSPDSLLIPTLLQQLSEHPYQGVRLSLLSLLGSWHQWLWGMADRNIVLP